MLRTPWNTCHLFRMWVHSGCSSAGCHRPVRALIGTLTTSVVIVAAPTHAVAAIRSANTPPSPPRESIAMAHAHVRTWRSSQVLRNAPRGSKRLTSSTKSA